MKGYETRDVSPGALSVVALAMIAAGILIGWVNEELFSRLKRAHPQAMAAETLADFPAPRLQGNPEDELRRYRAEQARILDSYGWVDREAGVVRIPVRRAMEELSHGR